MSLVLEQTNRTYLRERAGAIFEWPVSFFLFFFRGPTNKNLFHQTEKNKGELTPDGKQLAEIRKILDAKEASRNTEDTSAFHSRINPENWSYKHTGRDLYRHFLSSNKNNENLTQKLLCQYDDRYITQSAALKA